MVKSKLFLINQIIYNCRKCTKMRDYANETNHLRVWNGQSDTRLRHLSVYPYSSSR